MTILLVADNEETALWGTWSEQMANQIKKVSIILSAGDLSSYYLEHLADNINVPVIFVPGNHDGGYMQKPPRKCINTDERITEFRIARDGETKNVRVFGIGGSMRYKNGPYQYSEEEQSYRVERMISAVRKKRVMKQDSIDILLTHAPCKGYGDMQDIPHRGFECFNDFLYEFRPKLHCYGHIHEEYNFLSSAADGKGYQKILTHPSGTTMINGSGYCFIII